MIQEVPRISAIIPSYQRPELLRKAVLSVFEQDLPKEQFELIVVDSSPNGGDAASIADLLKESPCAFRCLVKEAEGAGSSRNYGSRQACAEILAFMDNDCKASPQWLREILTAFDEDPEIGLVQGKTLPDPEGRLGVFTHYIDVRQENFIYEAANVGYRRAAFEQVDGFPLFDPAAKTRKPFGGEDLVLAWNVKKRGWKSCFAANALVHHAVLPLHVKDWLYNKTLGCWPWVLANHPELRRHFFGRYFLNRSQALFTLGLGGLLGAAVFGLPYVLLLLPYFLVRSSETTNTLKGLLRPVRGAVYFLQDACTFVILLRSSIRFRSLLL